MPLHNPTNNPRLVPILTVKLKEETLEVYLLHPGDNFTRFGGSSRGLTVIKTPSLIVREISPAGTTDTEYDTFDQRVWTMIRRVIRTEAYAEGRAAGEECERKFPRVEGS